MRMAQPRRRLGFAQETGAGARMRGEVELDDLDRHGATQRHVGGAVGDAHGSAPQLDGGAIVREIDLVVGEPQAGGGEAGALPRVGHQRHRLAIVFERRRQQAVEAKPVGAVAAGRERATAGAADRRGWGCVHRRDRNTRFLRQTGRNAARRSLTSASTSVGSATVRATSSRKRTP